MLSSLSLLLLASASPMAQAEPEARVMRLDVVELLGGREVPGEGQWAHDRYGLELRFRSEANLKAFLADPQRFEPQMAGACARMGELSGDGDPEIWAVHEDRLYLFASESCRAGFLAAPDALLRGATERTVATPEELEEGRARLVRALEPLGGIQAFRTLRSWSREHVRMEDAGGETWRVRDSLWATTDGRHRRETAWNDDVYGWFVTPERALRLPEREPIHPLRRLASRRATAFEIPLLLHRACSPRGVLRPLEVEDWRGEQVRPLRFEDDLVRADLLLDPRDDRLRAVRFSARGPRMAYGTVEVEVTRWVERDGLRVPQEIETRFTGEPWKARSGTLGAVRVNDDLGPRFELE